MDRTFPVADQYVQLLAFDVRDDLDVQTLRWYAEPPAGRVGRPAQGTLPVVLDAYLDIFRTDAASRSILRHQRAAAERIDSAFVQPHLVVHDFSAIT